MVNVVVDLRLEDSFLAVGVGVCTVFSGAGAVGVELELVVPGWNDVGNLCREESDHVDYGLQRVSRRNAIRSDAREPGSNVRY